MKVAWTILSKDQQEKIDKNRYWEIGKTSKIISRKSDLHFDRLIHIMQLSLSEASCYYPLKLLVLKICDIYKHTDVVVNRRIF